MKTFKVKGGDGSPIEAEQLATFTSYIQGHQFRFVVTRLPGICSIPVVTHRISGSVVCDITNLEQMACIGDIKGAAKLALSKLVTWAGEDRVRSVLYAAEKA